MTHKTIANKMNELFQQEEETRKEEIKTFLQGVQSNYAEVVQQTRKSLLSFLLFWVAFYAIGVGIIEEGEIASLKISKIKTLLIVAPPVLGALYYHLIASIVAARYFGQAISQAYKHLLPTAYELDLELLLAPPTIFRVEGYLSNATPSKLLNRLSLLWKLIITMVIIIGGTFAVGHVSYLMWSLDTSPLYQIILSLSLGWVLWLRGIILIVINGKV